MRISRSADRRMLLPGQRVTQVPDFRIQKCNAAEVNPKGDYVLYWMIANRRTHWNFSLQRAVEWSNAIEQAARDPGGSSMRLPMGI